MNNHTSRRRTFGASTLVETSPLRRADPRTKLLLALCLSLAVTLTLAHLAVFSGLCFLLLLWGRLLPAAARQVWRLKWFLLVLFALDTWLVGLSLAATITLRLLLLACTFAILFATTTPRELAQALESLHCPYRYAFSLGLAFQSLSLIDEEWQAVREAQAARGIALGGTGWRRLPGQVRELVALSVPVVVLTTRRAWAITEAAYARGFDAPHRRPAERLHLGRLDLVLFAGSLLTAGLILLWR